MTNTETEQASRYAEKIAMLLRKAESTTPEEAESIMAKVQELMTLYAIDEQMIARAAGTQVQEEIVEGVYRFTGIFQSTAMNLGFAVARHNNCKAFFVNNQYARPKNHAVHFFGFESDVRNVGLLITSLEVQMVQAMTRWTRTIGDFETMSKMQRYKIRREFIGGFAAAIGARLYAAVKAGREEAKRAEAERSHVNAATASSSVELVVLGREEQVKNWFDERHGKGLRSVTRRYSSSGDGRGRAAGHAAGSTANIGQPSVGGGRKSIGR